MSGSPISNDIEDVVSSVRRLVSVDARTRPVSRDLGADRLLLTPSLRIVPDSGAARTTKVPLVLTAPAAQDPVAWEPAADVKPLPDPIDVQAAESAALHVVETEWEDEIWAEPDLPLAELALGVEEAELAIGEEAAPVLPAPPTLTLGDPAADADMDAPWDQSEGDWAEDQPAPVVSFDRNRARAASIAEAGPSRGAPVELTDTDGNPLTILDEAALQEVVRQLIREELQGSLGERITRNVRKLVRAEINRALTARSLD